MSNTYIYNTGNMEIKQADYISNYESRKRANIIIYEAYRRIGLYAKAERLRTCFTFMKIARHKLTGRHKLIFANSCKVRLCPCCAWRRSKKFGLENYEMLKDLSYYKYVFLTVTIRNCSAAELPKAVDDIMQGWRKMYRRKDVKEMTAGAIRTLEITYNRKNHSYHPHMHIIFAVHDSYFGRGYIKQEKWSQIWRECMNLDYNPVTDVRRIKQVTGDKAYMEISKYVVKLSSVLNVTSEKELDNIICTLEEALFRRRTIHYTGIFRQWRREKKLADDIKDNEAVEISDPDEWDVYIFRWIYGEGRYFLINDDETR